jgi:hypothetical protein
MKYNIGDVVQMNSMWESRYGIIIHIDDRNEDYPPVYRVMIQGHTNPFWLNHSTILRKVD